ncbi:MULTISPECIES: hypothetical protein [unclassified Luteibacter]|jgi:hypothetical protein|uniref:hypothetical protein n=1 Tax=Luteibacter sp. PvP019 TaxID=3156436 RepID=UPI003398BEB8
MHAADASTPGHEQTTHVEFEKLCFEAMRTQFEAMRTQAEVAKVWAEHSRTQAETIKAQSEVKWYPYVAIASLAAACMGAGAALYKLLTMF